MATPTILVAEDDPAMRRWIVKVLTSLGRRIRTVSDGWEVWAALMEEDIDLVVSDIHMPMKSGLEILAVARISGIRVSFLLITAFASDDVRTSAAELGAEVLDKPFAATDLLAHVRRMCPAG